MSKSKGNVVYPEMLIDHYGLDATKYFLLREFSFGQDAVFSPEGFVERFNFDLCNDLGNLLNRTIGMVNKYFGGMVPKYEGHVNLQDEELENQTIKAIKGVEQQYDSYHINLALEEIWKIISMTNKYIDETTPWILAKEEKTKQLKSVMYHLMENLRKIAIMLKPVMEKTANEILRQLGIEREESISWDSLRKNDGLIENSKVIAKGEPLFVRLEKEAEINAIKERMKNK